ncbi:MAG: winged helix-turn-helix domain-containing protein [Vicinamibacterales bacterium]
MTYTFSNFDFECDALELRREGRVVRLEPQPARALALLLANAGEVVTREELRAAIWGDDTHVDYDRGLAYCIGQIRTALGDSAEQPRFVQTLPRRGFRFIAPVSRSGSASATRIEAPAEPQATAQAAPAPPRPWIWALGGALAMLVSLGVWNLWAARTPVVVAVSLFDNETGDASQDAFVGGLSDVVVAHLAQRDPTRLGVVGNAPALRRTRNIRNLDSVAATVRADYVILGQLQRQDDRLRFIVHFIRLRDQVHLSAQRFVREPSDVRAFESDVLAEVDRVLRAHLPGA